jgi:hypothetical protein
MSKWGSYPALAAFALGAVIFTAPVQGSTIYNNINNAPGALPPNVQSLGYQATQTAQFGDLIQFAGTDRSLTSVTLVMSDWALASDFPSMMGPTWNMPLTLNLFNVDNSGANPQPGSLIATMTQTFAIPWRPVADPTCKGGTAWRAGDGNCYNGLAFEVTFNFAGTTVPNQIIYGLAFNTETWGAAPTGVAGPYVSLNFGGNDSAPPSVGSRPFPDTAYWNTATASNYADNGAGGTGTFRRDTGWSAPPPPFSGAVSFQATTLSATPEPGTLAMLGLGLLGIGLVARRRSLQTSSGNQAAPSR